MPRTPAALSLAPLALSLLLGVTPEATARDAVTYPYPCVEHLHRTIPGLDAHVVSVDLTCGQIGVTVTRPRERYSTVATFAREHDAQIAINTNFFGGRRSCGLAVGEGEVWMDSYQERPSPCAASFAFGPGPTGTRALLFDSFTSLRANPFPSWAQNIITGKPMLLRGGAVVVADDDPTGMYRSHPRTLVGTTPGGTTLVLAVFDGRWRGLPGVTTPEMLPLLEEFGVSDAINLDGGGSSELWIAAEGGVVNRPSDRRERTVLVHLGIQVTSALGTPMPPVP